MSAPVEEKLVKPSAAKQADQATKPANEKPRFVKPTPKTADKTAKPEEKVSNDKPPEKTALKTVRTIDDKAKEKSVTIVDKRDQKNGPTKANSTVNNKSVEKNSLANKDKPVTKVVNEKPAAKAAPVEKPKLKIPDEVVIKPIEKEPKPDPKVLKAETKPSPAKAEPKTPAKAEPKPSTPVKAETKPVAAKLADKSEDTMATKPPMPLDKSPAKVRI